MMQQTPDARWLPPRPARIVFWVALALSTVAFLAAVLLAWADRAVRAHTAEVWLERQQKHGHLITPRRGFYVIVPPQFMSWGAPPPSWYIDALMRHEGRPYYVGLLKAAELHGATHHAVMEFQVVTDKRLPKIRAGR
jgi:hypothetical protein